MVDNTINILVAEPGLSTFRSSDAFKKSMCIPPHAYQVKLSLEHAEALLLGTAQSIRPVSLRLQTVAILEARPDSLRPFIARGGESPRNCSVRPVSAFLPLFRRVGKALGESAREDSGKRKTDAVIDGLGMDDFTAGIAKRSGINPSISNRSPGQNLRTRHMAGRTGTLSMDG
jgi:hypothetical protein